MITIAGLTPKQHALMEVLWTIDSLDKVQAFIKTLPKEDAMDCLGLVEIAVQETYEQEGFLKDYKDAALDCIAAAMR